MSINTLLPVISGVHELPRMLDPDQVNRIVKLASSASHHDDEENGHHRYKPEDRRFRSTKPYRLDWVASLINVCMPRLRIGNLTVSAVDPDMQVYRLPEGGGAVERHMDEDFTTEDGSMALCSILVYLNEGYLGGETVFNGKTKGPHPKAGAGLLFRHDVPHEGLPVIRGNKYVLKTDLLFR